LVRKYNHQFEFLSFVLILGGWFFSLVKQIIGSSWKNLKLHVGITTMPKKIRYIFSLNWTI
jgi:hypothetical protein